MSFLLTKVRPVNDCHITVYLICFVDLFSLKNNYIFEISMGKASLIEVSFSTHCFIHDKKPELKNSFQLNESSLTLQFDVIRREFQ